MCKVGDSVSVRAFGKRRNTTTGTHTVEYRATDVVGDLEPVGSSEVLLTK